MFHRPLILLQIVQLILFIVDSGCTKQMTFEHSCSSLGRQCQMASAENNTSGPVPQYQASVFMAMTFDQSSSSLVLHQITSDHNRSELGIHDHSNEPSSSKLVPKVVPLAVKTANYHVRVGITIPQSYPIAEGQQVVRLGINPMIQPEPEDLPKDNPKLEIAVLRWQYAPASEY
ncbi:hypothetical protein Tco_0913286 [Tanacetum coccineum]